MKKNKNNEVVTIDNNYTPLVKKSKRRNELLSNKETSILKKENRKLIKLFIAVGSIVLSIILVSCIIDIFTFFKENIHPHVAYLVVAIIVILLIVLVIRPIVVAMSTPCFTLDVIEAGGKKNISKINYQKLIKISENLIEQDNISTEAKNNIKANLNNRNNLNLALRDIYDTEISKQINKIITDCSTKVFLSTAISQNDKFDSATIAIINVRMIMRIVIACGYHPTYPQLYKLIAKVFRNALLAYTIQSLKIDEVIFNGINTLVKGALNSIPFLKDVTKSVTQGAANALLTLRIGIITRKYLYEEFDIQAMLDNKDLTNEMILEESVNEANNSIGTILEECKKQNKEAEV